MHTPGRKRTRFLVVGALVVGVGVVAAFAVPRLIAHGTNHPVSIAAARQQLASDAGGMFTLVVAVPGGYEGATYDRFSHINFWSNTTGSWQELSEDIYPKNYGNPAYPSPCGGSSVNVTGVLLPSMQHATFIVCGQFAIDGSLWNVVFAYGRDGWRYLIPKSSELVPSGSDDTFSTQAGEYFAAHFADGKLQTAVNTSVFSAATGAAYPLVTVWQPNGSSFHQVADNAFVSKDAASPPTSIPSLPSPAPQNGMYGAALQKVASHKAVGADLEAAVSLSVTPEPITAECFPDAVCGAPSSASQSFVVSANTPVVLPVFTSDGQGVRYITAPAWYIACLGAMSALGETSMSRDLFERPSEYGQSGKYPWYIPSSLNVTAFLASVDYFAAGSGQPVELKFTGGVISQIVIA